MKKEESIRRGIGLIVLVVVAVIFFITLFAGFIIDLLWFDSLTYTHVFWKILSAKFFYFALFATLGFIFLGVNLTIAHRVAKREGTPLSEGAIMNLELGEYTEPLRQLTSGAGEKLQALILVVAGIFALLTGLGMIPYWDTFLRYFNSVPFGQTDPIFENDIGLYVFALPAYKVIKTWLLSLIFFSFVGAGVIYGIGGMFKLEERLVLFSKNVKTHLYALIAIGLLMKVWDYRLQMYELLYSKQGLIFGAGYTDYYVNLTALWLLLAYMLALVVFTVSGIFSSKNRIIWLGIGLILIIPLAAVTRGMLPGVVQQMIVKPNELTKETPFIKHNIKMTNEAYGLTDISVKPFLAKDSITLDDLRNNQETTNNIRLWDARPLLVTYKQNQAIRSYYTFYNVDVDRYTLDGKVQQVLLSPRELAKENLPSQTWVNTRLMYTHGYGMVMNPVNSVNKEGQPDLFIENIPPVSKVDLPITNPAIYYGEQPAQQKTSPQNTSGRRSVVNEKDDYVIVKTRDPESNKPVEFDYPIGDTNKNTTYEGNGGVWMGSLFRRLLFAWGFKDMNILLTGSTTDESRIMFRRNIQARIKHIAPFLELDSDPYIVLSEGRILWMQDAYTTTDRFPYSERVYYNRKPVNYIRNSVKIVVDSYHGSVDFYVIDEKDPLIQTYRNIFPDLFKDFASMSEDLKSHIRYPRDLFYIQMLQYNTYHMKEPNVFYNKEDLWTVPKENYGGETITMEPYYIQMRLPGEESLEFILMNPLTPNKKDNMIAWFAARSDGEHYGELLVYKFPKGKRIYGPSQIEARIDQDTVISQQFSLWDQRGSSIVRGNLLVIPVENSILYVEPVYLKAEQRDLPEMKRVIVSHGGEVAMGENLQAALEAAFGGKLREAEQQLIEQVPAASLEELQEGELGDVIQGLVKHFDTARKSLSEGDWVKYGEEMKRAEEIIRMLQQKYGKQE